MFNFSFGEVCVIVTATSFLLGRKEMVAGARIAGNMVGQLVGSLQGLRVKYEAKSTDSEIGTLHTSVRSGLRDLSTVGYDLMSVSPMRIMSSPLTSQSYHPQPNSYNPNNSVPSYDPNVTVNPPFNPSLSPTFDPTLSAAMITNNAPYNPTMVTNPLDGVTSNFESVRRATTEGVSEGGFHNNYSSVVSETAAFNFSQNVPQYTPQNHQNFPQNQKQSVPQDNAQAAAVNYHLSRLIMAEREFFMREQSDAQLRNGGRPVPNNGDYPSQPGGADILHSVISDCIVADTYNK